MTKKELFEVLEEEHRNQTISLDELQLIESEGMRIEYNEITTDNKYSFTVKLGEQEFNVFLEKWWR
jgi:hypothetical protein